MRFTEFLNECGGLKCVLVLSEYKPCTVDFSVYKKYKKYQQGLVKAWGGLLYLDFDKLGKSLKCASIDDYKDTFIEYMDANDDELDDLNDWIADMPPSLDGKPLFDKDRIENDLLEMSMLTKSESDIVIFRVHKDKNDWKKGWKSYTIYPEMYDANIDNCVAFKISKGCPLIFASELADKGEIIANLTHPSIKQYVAILEIEK